LIVATFFLHCFQNLYFDKEVVVNEYSFDVSLKCFNCAAQ